MPRHNNRQLSLETLTIVDPTGKPRVLLTTDANTHMPALHFLDATRGDRFVIGLALDGTPGLVLLREDGSPAINIGVNEHGTSGIRVTYPNGLPAIHISLPASGNIEINVYDTSGSCFWKLNKENG
jgi:hypothetical protein